MVVLVVLVGGGGGLYADFLNYIFVLVGVDEE